MIYPRLLYTPVTREVTSISVLNSTIFNDLIIVIAKAGLSPAFIYPCYQKSYLNFGKLFFWTIIIRHLIHWKI